MLDAYVCLLAGLHAHEAHALGVAIAVEEHLAGHHVPEGLHPGTGFTSDKHGKAPAGCLSGSSGTGSRGVAGACLEHGEELKVVARLAQVLHVQVAALQQRQRPRGGYLRVA